MKRNGTRVAAWIGGLCACLAACAAPASEGLAPPEAAADAPEAFFLGAAPEPLVAGRFAAEGEAAPAALELEAQARGRQVIYSALLRLVVVSVSESASAVLAIAKEAGGWMQASDARSITVRVPAAHFEDALARIARLGEVVDRAVQASDVTEELLDLDIRLENLRKARERLLEHLAKSQSMEDTLAIEAELTRVTGELERIEGRKRYLESQVAMSTIRVELNSSVPQSVEDGLAVPFEWVRRLGDGLVAGTVEGLPKKPSFFAKGPAFDPPAGFLRYYSSKALVEAMDADGLRLKVQRHENYDEGALDFWKRLARRALVESRALALAEERDLGAERALIRGTRDVAGQRQAYLLVLARTKKHVYTFEAWGPAELFAAQAEALEASARSLDT
jgi:hypothetical protein